MPYYRSGPKSIIFLLFLPKASIALVYPLGQDKFVKDGMKLQCDLEQFRQYLELLTEHDSRHGDHKQICHIHLNELDDGGTGNYFWTLADLDESLFKKLVKKNATPATVSVGIQEFGEDLKPIHSEDGFNRQAREVSRIRCFVLDIDRYLDKETLKKLLAKIKPSWVVVSSEKNGEYKTHIYFRIAKESREFEDDLVDFFNDIQKAMASYVDEVLEELLGEDAPKKGWCDRSVIKSKPLRAPGFLHQKDLKNVTLTRLFTCPDAEDITKKNFKQFLNKLDITPERIEKARKEQRERLATGMDFTPEQLQNGYPGAEEGERNNMLFAYAKQRLMNYPMTQAEIFGLLRIWDLSNTPPIQYDPALDDPLAELHEIAASAYSYFKESHSPKYLESVREGKPKLVKDYFLERSVRLQQSLKGESVELPPELRNVERLINLYNYSQEPYKHTTSDAAIRQRCYDAFGDVIKHSRYLDFLVFDKKKGIWDESTGEKLAHGAIVEVCTNLQYEQGIKDRFPYKEPDLGEYHKLSKDEKALEDKKADLGVDTAKLEDFITRKLDCHNTHKLLGSLKRDDRFDIDINLLDTEPLLINAPNGILDLATGKLLAHDPAKHFTRCTAYPIGDASEYADMGSSKDWKRNAWTKFVYEITCGQLDFANFLQEALGYSMLGENPEQFLLLCLGVGNNGKSVLLETGQLVMGSFAGNVPQSIIAGENRSGGSENNINALFARLRGVRLAVADDMKDKLKWDTSVVRKLTAPVITGARHLGKDPFDYLNTMMVIFQGNHPPIITDESEGTYRRFKAASFDYTVPEHTRIRSLQKKLASECGSEILTWMAAGAKRYLSRGSLLLPQEMVDFSESLRKDVMPMRSFVDEMCEVCLDKQRAETVGDIADAYMLWADHHDVATQIVSNNRAFTVQIKPIIENKLGKRYDPESMRTNKDRKLPLVFKDKDYADKLRSLEVQRDIQKLRSEHKKVFTNDKAQLRWGTNR